MKKYLLKFSVDARSVLNSMDSVDENETSIHAPFDDLCTTLDLESKGYDLKLKEQKIVILRAC